MRCFKKKLIGNCVGHCVLIRMDLILINTYIKIVRFVCDISGSETYFLSCAINVIYLSESFHLFHSPAMSD